MNSFAYIYCGEILILYSRARIHISHTFSPLLLLFASTCQKTEKKKTLLDAKKRKSFGMISKIQWSLVQDSISLDHIRAFSFLFFFSFFFAQCKMLQNNILILFSTWEPTVLSQCWSILHFAASTTFSLVQRPTAQIYTSEVTLYVSYIAHVIHT